MRNARALAVALTRNPYSLVLAGKQSLDEGSGVLPSALAEVLGVADFSSVTDLHWDASARQFTFHQILEGRVRSVRAPPPVVIGSSRPGTTRGPRSFR